MATQRMTLVMESHDPLSGVWEQAQGAGYRDSGFRVQDWGLVGLVWGIGLLVQIQGSSVFDP